jgi:hypothetical protein
MQDDKFYNLNIRVPKNMDADGVRNFLTNEVYIVGCLFFETIGERNQMLLGNGHHMAQDLVAEAEKIWDRHLWKKNK